MDNTKHTANFLVSKFLLSKRSLKKIYNLNPAAIGILRYICDSIDLNFKKRKLFQSKIYQSQIAKHCHCTIKTAREHIKFLVKKKLIKYDTKKYIFTIGKVLIAWVNITEVKEVGKNYLGDRSRSILPTSNSSNITKESVKNITTVYNKNRSHKAERPSALLEEWMKKHNVKDGI